MEIKIQKNVPIPAKAKKKTKYPFEKMGVGDSFVAPVKPAGLYQSALKWAKNNDAGCRFVVRAEGDGSRCWRAA
jgi:hypothetical protein